MCESRRKLLLENLLLKNGAKWKSENIIKKTFKNLQKTEKNRKSHEALKTLLVSNSVGIGEHTLTLKKGKRKRVVKTTVFLVSERVRYLEAWKNVIKPIRSQKRTKAFFLEVSDKINQLLKASLARPDSLKVEVLIHKKHGFKFKW